MDVYVYERWEVVGKVEHHRKSHRITFLTAMYAKYHLASITVIKSLARIIELYQISGCFVRYHSGHATFCRRCRLRFSFCIELLSIEYNPDHIDWCCCRELISFLQSPYMTGKNSDHKTYGMN
jgi:hypothetical protein